MLRTATLLATAMLATVALSGTAAGSDPIGELMKVRGASGQGDPAKIRQLEEALRRAEASRAAEVRAEAEAKSNRETSPIAENVPAAAAHTAEVLVQEESVEGDEQEPAVAEPEPVYPAGCMYSGTKLIWERKPGTCH